MAEARQVKNRIVQAVLRECQKLKEKDDLTDELEHVRDIKNKKERLIKSVALASEAPDVQSILHLIRCRF